MDGSLDGSLVGSFVVDGTALGDDGGMLHGQDPGMRNHVGRKIIIREKCKRGVTLRHNYSYL